jgi:coproporphyrinogen III oxidase
VPTVHANFRRLERGDAGWFGGGADLTPYYLRSEDAVHFHRTLKQACDGPRPGRFFRASRPGAIATSSSPTGARPAGGRHLLRLPRRRGRGHRRARRRGAPATESPRAGPERLFAFVRSAGDAFLDAYLPIVERRRAEPWTEEERHWQLIRRGRYVEFNLVYDRGTIFGLKTDGRVESILMSLPTEARWEYGHAPTPGSREEETLTAIRAPRDWAAG